MLCDSSKIGVESSLRFASVSDVDVLVTDSAIKPDDQKALDAAGVEVVIA